MTALGPRSIERFAHRCREAGFDIVHPFRVDSYNAHVEAPIRLPDFSRTAALGILVGNTRLLWEVFCRALAADPSRVDDEHPLERYVRERVTAAAEGLGATHTIFWADAVEPSAVPIQRIAHAAGLAWLSPSYLSIHPTYGPWFAFRSVIVLDEDYTVLEGKPAPDPCTPCAKPCLIALERAVTECRTLDQSAVTEHFDLWRRVREVCPQGGDHRYSEEQLRYHYIKDREILGKRARR